MIRPLLLAGLTILTLGGATAAHAHGDSRGDRYDAGRRGCETRSRYSNSWEEGRRGRAGYRGERGRYGYGSSRYGGGRRSDYRERDGRWDDRDEYRDRGREHARADDRYEQDWDDRDERQDRLEPEVLPVRPRNEVTQPGNRTPGAVRRTPNSGVTRRPAS